MLSRKVIAVFLSLILCLHNMLGGISPAFASPVKTALSASSFEINLPGEFGRVTEWIPGDAGKPVVFHIQTAHGNYDIQKNIQKILQYLKEKKDIRHLFLEGASHPLTPEAFQFFPENSKLNLKIADALMKDGQLTGAETFLLENTRDTRGWGVEDFQSYRRNRQVFKLLMAHKPELDQFLTWYYQQLEKIQTSLFQKDLKSLLQNRQAFDSGQLALESWLTYLQKRAVRILAVDLHDIRQQVEWPMLHRYFKIQSTAAEISPKTVSDELAFLVRELTSKKIAADLQTAFRAALGQPYEAHGPSLRFILEKIVDVYPDKINWTKYPNLKLDIQRRILIQELIEKNLFEEIQRLFHRLAGVLAQTDEEKKALGLLEQHLYLKQLFSLQIGRPEYEALIASGKKKLYPQDFLKTFQNAPGSQYDAAPLSHGKFRFFYKQAMLFYRDAVLREDLITRNLLSKMNKLEAEAGVLVTGGFHTEGIKDGLVRKGYAYVQITPRMDVISVKNRDSYLKALFGNSIIAESKLEPPVRSDLTQMSELEPGFQQAAGQVLLQNLKRTIELEHAEGSSQLITNLHNVLPGHNYGQFVNALRSELRSENNGAKETESYKRSREVLKYGFYDFYDSPKLKDENKTRALQVKEKLREKLSRARELFPDKQEQWDFLEKRLDSRWIRFAAAVSDIQYVSRPDVTDDYLLSFYEPEGYAAGWFLAKEMMEGLPLEYAVEFAFREAVKDSLSPIELQDVQRKIFPENYPVTPAKFSFSSKTKKEEVQPLDKRVREFLEKRVVSEYLQPVIALMGDIAIAQWQAQEKKQPLGDDKRDEFGRRLRDVLAGLNRQKYWRDKIIKQVGDRRGEGSLEEVHAVMGRAGVYDSILRHLIIQMRKAVSEPDFENLNGYYMDYYIVSHMGAGFGDNPWLMEEAEEYNEELRSLLKVVSMIGPEQKEIFEASLTEAGRPYAQELLKILGSGVDLEDLPALKKARDAMDLVASTFEQLGSEVPAFREEALKLASIHAQMVRDYLQKLKSLQRKIRRPETPSKYARETDRLVFSGEQDARSELRANPEKNDHELPESNPLRFKPFPMVFSGFGTVSIDWAFWFPDFPVEEAFSLLKLSSDALNSRQKNAFLIKNKVLVRIGDWNYRLTPQGIEARRETDPQEIYRSNDQILRRYFSAGLTTEFNLVERSFRQGVQKDKDIVKRLQDILATPVERHVSFDKESIEIKLGKEVDVNISRVPQQEGRHNYTMHIKPQRAQNIANLQQFALLAARFSYVLAETILAKTDEPVLDLASEEDIFNNIPGQSRSELRTHNPKFRREFLIWETMAKMAEENEEQELSDQAHSRAYRAGLKARHHNNEKPAPAPQKALSIYRAGPSPKIRAIAREQTQRANRITDPVYSKEELVKALETKQIHPRQIQRITNGLFSDRFLGAITTPDIAPGFVVILDKMKEYSLLKIYEFLEDGSIRLIAFQDQPVLTFSLHLTREKLLRMVVMSEDERRSQKVALYSLFGGKAVLIPLGDENSRELFRRGGAYKVTSNDVLMLKEPGKLNPSSYYLADGTSVRSELRAKEKKDLEQQFQRLEKELNGYENYIASNYNKIYRKYGTSIQTLTAYARKEFEGSFSAFLRNDFSQAFLQAWSAAIQLDTLGDVLVKKQSEARGQALVDEFVEENQGRALDVLLFADRVALWALKKDSKLKMPDLQRLERVDNAYQLTAYLAIHLMEKRLMVESSKRHKKLWFVRANIPLVQRLASGINTEKLVSRQEILSLIAGKILEFPFTTETFQSRSYAPRDLEEAFNDEIESPFFKLGSPEPNVDEGIIRADTAKGLLGHASKAEIYYYFHNMNDTLERFQRNIREGYGNYLMARVALEESEVPDLIKVKLYEGLLAAFHIDYDVQGKFVAEFRPDPAAIKAFLISLFSQDIQVPMEALDQFYEFREWGKKILVPLLSSNARSEIRRESFSYSETRIQSLKREIDRALTSIDRLLDPGNDFRPWEFYDVTSRGSQIALEIRKALDYIRERLVRQYAITVRSSIASSQQEDLNKVRKAARDFEMMLSALVELKTGNLKRRPGHTRLETGLGTLRYYTFPWRGVDYGFMTLARWTAAANHQARFQLAILQPRSNGQKTQRDKTLTDLRIDYTGHAFLDVPRSVRELDMTTGKFHLKIPALDYEGHFFDFVQALDKKIRARSELRNVTPKRTTIDVEKFILAVYENPEIEKSRYQFSVPDLKAEGLPSAVNFINKAMRGGYVRESGTALASNGKGKKVLFELTDKAKQLALQLKRNLKARQIPQLADLYQPQVVMTSEDFVKKIMQTPGIDPDQFTIPQLTSLGFDHAYYYLVLKTLPAGYAERLGGELADKANNGRHARVYRITAAGKSAVRARSELRFIQWGEQNIRQGGGAWPSIRHVTLEVMDGILPVAFIHTEAEGEIRLLLESWMEDISQIRTQVIQSDKNLARQKNERAKQRWGLQPQGNYAYILGPEFAFDSGGLAIAGSVLGSNPSVVMVRDKKDEQVLALYNEKLKAWNKPLIFPVKDIAEAQLKLAETERFFAKGEPYSFIPHALVNADEWAAERLKETLKDQMTLVTKRMFDDFVEISGIRSLVDEIKAQFLLARSA